MHDPHHDHGHSQVPSIPAAQTVKFLYIDPIAGASGDMFLGALVDLGADFDALKAELAKLEVPGFRLDRHATKRHTIGCVKVEVHVEDVPHPHRHLSDMLALVDKAPVADRVKERARTVFLCLAEAEAAAHRMPVEKVHFHEVGGLDCLVDIVGTCVALELLGIDTIVSGPVAVGTGVVGCDHGKMPVPAPGTLGILKDYPIRKTCFEGEMTTPTGAAIIAALAMPVTDALIMTPVKIGYGAGTKDKPQIANMLRVVLAETDRRFLAGLKKREAAEPHRHDHEHHHHHHGHDHHHHHDHEHAHEH